MSTMPERPERSRAIAESTPAAPPPMITVPAVTGRARFVQFSTISIETLE